MAEANGESSTFTIKKKTIGYTHKMCGHPSIEQKPESQIVKTTVIGDFTVSCELSVVAFV